MNIQILTFAFLMSCSAAQNEQSYLSSEVPMQLKDLYDLDPDKGAQVYAGHMYTPGTISSLKLKKTLNPDGLTERISFEIVGELPSKKAHNHQFTIEGIPSPGVYVKNGDRPRLKDGNAILEYTKVNERALLLYKDRSNFYILAEADLSESPAELVTGPGVRLSIYGYKVIDPELQSIPGIIEKGYRTFFQIEEKESTCLKEMKIQPCKE